MRYFDQVGDTVPYGETAITHDDADRFLSAAMDGVKIRSLFIGDFATEIVTTTYASGILSNASADYDVTEESCMSKTTFDNKPDRWRSFMMFARYNQKNRDTKIYNMYDIESLGGELMLARRQVRVIRDLTRVAIRDGDIFEEVYSRQRKAFEVPLTSEDVDLAIERKDRIMRRRLATGR